MGIFHVFFIFALNFSLVYTKPLMSNEVVEQAKIIENLQERVDKLEEELALFKKFRLHGEYMNTSIEKMQLLPYTGNKKLVAVSHTLSNWFYHYKLQMNYCDLFHSFIRDLLSIKSRLMRPSRMLRV